MTRDNFPALYQSADQISLGYQRSFFRALFWNLALLVIAAEISVLGSPRLELVIFQTCVLLGAVGCSFYLFLGRPDRYWYTTRAVAESIKTATWRFVSRAEPFNNDDTLDRNQFPKLLKSIVEQNRDVAKKLTTHLDKPQISERMIALRASNLDDRKQNYVEHRVVDQQRWYASKASHNEKMARRFFAFLIIVNIAAVAASILRITYPFAPFWPTDVFLALAAGILGWIQAKRFSELAASYALAAHEISLIREQAAQISAERDFSNFVGDAENAFSREHTQWVARKDS